MKNLSKKYNYWSSVDSKPKNWKCVGPSLYSNEVLISVYDEKGEYVFHTRFDLKYKLGEGRRLDKVWIDNYLKSLFGEYSRYEDSMFLRDGATIDYLRDVYIYNKNYDFFKRKMREEKLKRICDDKEN